MRVMPKIAWWMAVCTILAGGAGGQGMFEAGFIFDPAQESHGHTHASCLVECPNGDLLAVWYENGKELPPPFFSKEHDKSDDVRIGGSRKPHGSPAWEPAFVAADTFGVSDNNPCMVIDRNAKLWLFHAVLLGVPEAGWDSALIRYHIASAYDQPGAPIWASENLLVVHPVNLEAALQTGGRNDRKVSDEQLQAGMKMLQGRFSDPFKTRLGWMPRAHPIIRSDGALLLPLANETFGVGAMAITTDNGASWSMGECIPGRGLEQPTVVEFPDKKMVAFFRNGHFAHRILRSESEDGGMTWSPVTKTELPHPNAGIEAILLPDDRLLMIYNDSEKERDRLAVSLSEDRGKTWMHTRHLENAPGQRFDYPSIVRGSDGTFHATYSYNVKTIKYVHFDEQWLMGND